MRAARASCGATALAAAGAVLALGAPVAGAAVVPNAAYGGGALTAAAPLVGLRVAPIGIRVSFEGEAIARCARGQPVDERAIVNTALATSGSFRGLGRRTYRLSAAETRTIRLSVVGVVADGQRASGTLHLVVLVRRRGQALVRCDSHVQRWQARSVPALDPTPGPPLAGLAYYGGTIQVGHLVPFPFALLVSPNGARVETTLFRVYRRCTGVTSDEVPNDMPPATIRPDRSFSVTQRYSQRFSDSIEYFTFTLRGSFVTGGATGTLRATSVLRDPRTRRIIGRCDSRPVAWSAVP